MCDKIKFFLGERYFQRGNSTNSSSMRREVCIQILADVFGLPVKGHNWGSIMTANPGGFHILCRPDQWGFFILERHLRGKCINGIRDLQPCRVPEFDPIDELASATGASRKVVSRVLDVLKGTFQQRINLHAPLEEADVSPVADVSGNE